jgi:hypothetical protein
MCRASGAAKAVAPEDIRRGDVVAVLLEMDERVPFVSADEWRSSKKDIPTVRAWTLPPYPRAFRVLAVSLPFVYVLEDDDDKRLLDVRQVRLARLSGAVRRAAFPRKKKAGTSSKPAAAAASVSKEAAVPP